MKAELLDTTPAWQRRRWLAAVSASAAGLAAWVWHGRDRHAAPPTVTPNQAPRSADSTANPSASVRLVLRPSPDSVKRHG
jgi:hypothetical protein